jgi:thiol:disulfide interchange protein
MRKIIFSTILFSAFIVLAVFQTNAQNITGSIGTVSRGSSTKGMVVMSIPGGLHVNSNRPNSKYAIPTTLNITANGGRIAGITYPRGKNRKFSFSEDFINVYEGRVTFGFTLNVPKNFRGNTISVRVVARYQACTDEVCYPPRTKEITLTARVR